MKVKHSKYKNTGLIFELLVKQIAADTLSRKDSPAVKILKKFYTGNTSLVKEFKLYDSQKEACLEIVKILQQLWEWRINRWF